MTRQTVERPEVEAVRRSVEEGICPLCGQGPYKVVSVHTNKKHGVDKFALRNMAGMTSSEPTCLPEFSRRAKELAEQRDFGSIGPKGAPGPHRFTKAGARNSRLAGRVAWDSKAPAEQRDHIQRMAEAHWADRPSVEERLFSRLRQDGDCWTWTGSAKNGYGHIGVDGRTREVHRVAYEIMVGPIPEGLTIDHLCRNRSCANPDHMDPVPRSVNAARANALRVKTHCKRGHEFNSENTGRDHRGDRYCLPCHRMHIRHAARRRRAAAKEMVK